MHRARQLPLSLGSPSGILGQFFLSLCASLPLNVVIRSSILLVHRAQCFPIPLSHFLLKVETALRCLSLLQTSKVRLKKFISIAQGHRTRNSAAGI